MEMVVYWYDFVCFAIVGFAVLVSVYVLCRKEGCCFSSRRNNNNVNYNGQLEEENLLLHKNNDGGHVSSSSMWTSCWRGVHPVWLLAIRVLLFFVLTAVLSWDIRQWGLSIFMYYTEWTFSLVMLYFVIGSVISAHGCWLLYMGKAYIGDVESSEIRGHLEENRALKTYTNTRGVNNNNNNKGFVQLQSYYLQECTSQKAGFWGQFMQIIYQTCAGAAILTDIVFWCIIVPFLSNTHLRLSLLTGCMHTLNLGCLLIDTCVNRLTFPWFRLAYFVLWSCIYIVFQWLIHLCGFTWWPYPFLELSSPWAPLWYLILAVFLVACYGLYSLFIKLKNSLFSELFPHSYMGSS